MLRSQVLTVIVIRPMQESSDPVSQLLSPDHGMAHTQPTLSSGGSVQIRFSSIDLGTTKWREGTFEILEKDNKSSLCLRFNCGTLKFFQVFVFSPNFYLLFMHHGLILFTFFLINCFGHNVDFDFYACS